MQDRVTELESRVAFQEQLIDQLNDVVANQDKLLVELTRTVSIINQKISDAQVSLGQGIADEAPPPHY